MRQMYDMWPEGALFKYVIIFNVNNVTGAWPVCRRDRIFNVLWFVLAVNKHKISSLEMEIIMACIEIVVNLCLPHL